MQNSSLYKLRLHQVQRAIEPFVPLQGTLKPRGGWLRAIRESLGRSVRAQAALVGLSASTLQKSEVSEAEDRITLGQLRKLASGLDCELVYALVPRQPLQTMVEERADALAREEVMSVAHTMALEDQRPSDGFIERKMADRKQELLSGSWARLWR
jgi:predicted DNA-binding mobile mystery protein A